MRCMRSRYWRMRLVYLPSPGTAETEPRKACAKLFPPLRSAPDGSCNLRVIRFMSGSALGRLFCVTSFGESHGPAIGCVVDGCPPGLALAEPDIQRELDRRRPGTSRYVTQRQEADTVEILSGVF